MTKNRKLTNDEVRYILGVESYVASKSEAKEMKFHLLDTVKSIVGEDWYTFSEKTRNAIEYVCFLSAERGHFYARPDSIAAKYKIGKSTVYGALKVLRDLGILEKVNRTSREQNGLGSAVHLFTIHPFFPHFVEYLKLEKKANWKTDWKAEDSENPCGSKSPEEKTAPTYSLPTFSNKRIYKVIHTNVSTAVNTRESEVTPLSKEIENEKSEGIRKWFKFVPKTVNSLFAETFGEELVTLWRKIKLAVKNVKQGDMLETGYVNKLGVTVLRNLVKHEDFNAMVADEWNAYVYKSMKQSVLTAVGQLFSDEMVFEGSEGFYVTTDGEKVEANNGERTIEINMDNSYVQTYLDIMENGFTDTKQTAPVQDYRCYQSPTGEIPSLDAFMEFV